MRKLKFVSVFVLLALLLSVGRGVLLAQEPPPKVERVGRGGNRADPNYVYTAEELEALAVKDRLAEKHVQELDGVKGGFKILAVGYWPQPNNWAHRNYCGPGATQVALDARLPYWEVPDIDTIGEEENINPDWGIYISAIRPVLNTRLNTDWYWYGGSGSEQTLFNRIVWDMDHDYALATGCETNGMPGWGAHESGHIVAVYGYYRGTTDYAYYTETAGSVAGYNGPYRQCVTKGNMWQYVDGNDAQVW